MHGGTLPNVIAKLTRERALRELPMLGGAIETNPLDALLQCVYRAAGMAAWLRMQVEAIETADDVVSAGQLNVWVKLEAEALDRLARFAKDAVSAGVAERQVRIAERTGQRIAAALDEAIGPLDLPPTERTAVVQRFVTRLSVLEHDDVDGEAVDG